MNKTRLKAKAKLAKRKAMRTTNTLLWCGIVGAGVYAYAWTVGHHHGLDNAPPKVVAKLSDTETRLVKNVCAKAAYLAADKHKIPAENLIAIVRRESNFNPYVMNLEGETIRSDSYGEAIKKARRFIAAGRTSFDVGCGQINYRWHGQNFKNIEAMFDPNLNMDYAARYLWDLKDQHGTWSKAIANYHSKTQTHQTRYLAGISRALNDLARNAIEEIY